MYTLEEIFNTHEYGEHKREILFEFGEWCLYNKVRGTKMYMSNDYGTHIVHRCSRITNAISAREMECPTCREPVPDEIRAVMMLYTAAKGESF